MNFLFSNRKNLIIGSGVFFILFISTLIGGILAYQNIDQKMTKQVFDQRETVASLAASAIELKLDQLIAITQTYASNPDVIATAAVGDWSGAKSIIINLQNDPKNYNYFIGRFLLLDTQGNIKVSYPGIANEGIGKPDDALAELKAPILQNGADFFVSDVFRRSVYPNNNHMEILVPIRKGSVLVGVVEITVPINEFSDFGKDVDIGNVGFVYIVDRLGHIITHPKYSSDGPIVDYSSLPVIQNLMQGQSGTAINYNPFERQERAVAYEPVPVFGWGVISQEPVDEAFAARDGILKNIIYLIITLGLVELISVWIVLFLLGHNHRENETKK
jgi:hypothetical protein